MAGDDSAGGGSKFKQFSVHVLREDDYQLVLDYMQGHFFYEEPITRALGCTPNDTIDFYRDLCQNGLSGPYSLIAKDADGQLAGVILNSLYEYTSEPELQRQSNAPTTPNDRQKREFAEEIAKGPYASEKANQLLVLIEWVERDLRGLLPGCRRAFKIDILGVDPRYYGTGLACELTRLSIQRARELECEYVVTVATAVASQRLFSKLGFKAIRTLLFSDFLQNGQQVFRNLHDNGDGERLMVLRL